MIFCFVEKEYAGTQMKRIKKLYFMTAKDSLNFESKGLQSITFVPLFHSERLYIGRKRNECLAQEDLQLPIRKVKVYDSSGPVAFCEWYRILLDNPWPLDDHQNDKHEDSLQCPDHTEDMQESVN